MQSAVEKTLTKAHYAGKEGKILLKAGQLMIAIVFACAVPYFHIGVAYNLLHPDKPRVSKFSCTCDCFDTVFRGAYENPPSGYKHVYFNATRQTLKIWAVTVATVLLTYEAVKHLVSLTVAGTVRRPILALVALSAYPHYYSWWSYFSYYNEDFYSQWGHQTFFTTTELVSTCVLLWCADRRRPLETWHLLSVASINATHVVVGSLDQFVENVVFGRGLAFQLVRDVGLLVPDLFAVCVPLYLLQEVARRKKVKVSELLYKEEIMLAVTFVTLTSLIGRIL